MVLFYIKDCQLFLVLINFLFKVLYRRKALLGHELVTSFLCMRWNTFLKYIYYINLLTYIILMLLLTIYMHIYFVCELRPMQISELIYRVVSMHLANKNKYRQ